MKNTSIALSSLITAMTFSGAALAYEAGDILARVGVASVAPQDSSDFLALNGSESTLSGVLGGNSGLEVNENTQLGLTIEYMITNKWGVELLAATPFVHDAGGAGVLKGLQIGETKQLPPTLSAVYHFDVIEKLQPYVGIGINYTAFFEEYVTDEADAAFVGLGLIGGSLELEDSVGLAVQLGADYHLDENFSLNASIRWIGIETEAEVSFDSGDKITADLTIDPVVYTLAVGYKF